MKKNATIACAVLLALAGLMFSFKAAAIMLTGEQPPVAFELGQLLFPVGAVGLYLTVKEPGRLEKAGLFFAILGILGTVLSHVYSLLPGAVVSNSEEFVFPHSLFVLVGSMGGFIALFLMGLAIYRRRDDLGRQKAIPLIVAVIPIPLMVTVVFHFEAPIFLIGLAWLVLAYFLWSLVSPTLHGKDDQSAAA